MGELDLREKSLFAINDVFAALLNAFYLPKGAPPIQASELTDAPTETVSIFRGGVEHRFRDVFKCLRDNIGVGLAFFGVENQTHSAQDMPMRIMAYDALCYCNQYKQRQGNEKVLPIVTFVLYFGYDKPWNAPRLLSECIDVPEYMAPFFGDYPIHVIELAWLPDETIDRLTGDLKSFAQCLRSFRDRRFDECPEATFKYPEEVLTLLEKITGEAFFGKMLQTCLDKENLRMCEIFEEMRNNYKSIGKKEGLEQGELEQLKKLTQRIMSKMNSTLEDAMSYLQLEDSEKRRLRTAMA